MLKNGIKNKKMRTGRSLNLILWFTFSVFALSIILIYGVVQNILVHKRYYNQIAENLNVAGNEIVNTIANHDGSAPLSKQIYGIANKHGLQLYVLSEDGASKFPDHTEQDAYPEKTELLKKKLEGCEYKIFSEKSVIAYGDTVMIEGERQRRKFAFSFHSDRSYRSRSRFCRQRVCRRIDHKTRFGSYRTRKGTRAG